MNKCINCAYFLNCENASEENACDNYKFIIKNIEKEETKSQIERLIEIKNLEREIADIFYKLCPSVPPQTLATAVRQTIEGYRILEYLYRTDRIPEKELKRAIELEEEKRKIEKLSKETKISKEEIEKHITRID